MKTRHPEAAREFRRLHQSGILILANVWDAGSARLIENAGARALATSSAAVAWAHGYADGDILPPPLLLATVSEIARVVRVPLSVDMEGGYSNDPDAVGEIVAQVIDAGGVGINIEDGVADPALLCAKIERIRRAADRSGVELFVNARVDVYLRALAPPERRVAETLARAARYREAGADGIFVPGVAERGEIRELAAGVGLPLNVLARPGVPAAAELEALGARRLSAGSWIASAVLGRLTRLVTDFHRTGVGDPLFDGAAPYADVNALMAAR